MTLCPICGTKHHAYQAHVFASNAASNKSSASNRIASNNELAAPDRKAVERVVKDATDKADVSPPVVRVDAPTKQRWSKEAYNAYMREYMRKKRARLPA